MSNFQTRVPASRGPTAVGKTPGRTSIPTGRSQPSSTRPAANAKSNIPKGGVPGKGKAGGNVAGAGKGGKVPQGKDGNAAIKKPAQTKEDLMARKIQTVYRGYRYDGTFGTNYHGNR